MKRPLLHRFFSAFMALLVLTSSVGLLVQSHTCRSSGRSTAAIIFSAPRHTCPPATPIKEHKHQLPGKAELKTACCAFGAHLHKLDAASHALESTKLLPAALLALPPAPVWAPSVPAIVVAQAAAWHASDSSPPLRAGRTLLRFVCTWQV